MTVPARGTRYVAIGSSFAAGPGITPPAPDRPAKGRQSARNYPHLLAARYGLELIDVTSSGATADHILRSGQFGRPPQIDAVTEHTELVTVTAGGNDIGYIASLIAASAPAWLTKVPVLGTRLRHATAPAHADDRLTRTADSVAQVFTAIRQCAPRARVLCVDYLTVLTQTYHADLPFNEQQYHVLTGLADDLTAALALACGAHNVELIPAARHSIAHHAWAEQPWTTGWVTSRRGGQTAFHPNADGMTAVSDLIADSLAK